MIIKINNNKFKVKPMITKKDTQKGMMGRDFDSTFNGMLFLMDKGHHSFWMKGCIIPLDIIFINGDTITKISHNCQPCKTDECPNYMGSGDTILELKGGTCKKLGIESGDIIRY
jgi:hypothetical protein